MSQPKKRRVLKTVLIILVVLLAIRLALPYVILHYANKSLADMKGYHGHLEDIDLALIRGAYKLDSLYINKVDSITGEQTNFFSASSVDLSIEWKALFHGSLVGELVFEKPSLVFTREKVEPKTLQKDSSSFKDLKEKFMPLQINRFEVRQGNIRYRDENSKPPVDIAMTNAYILAQNLRNSYDSSALLPATIRANADVYGGEVNLSLKTNPLAGEPTFDMNTELKNTNLVELNEFFQAYAKVDVNKGNFGMYTEIAAKDGNFAGYVKPLIRDLDILGKEDRDDNLFQKLWEAVVGTAGEVLENPKKDQVATKIPFKGKIENPDANIWYAIADILRNAFIQAIQPSIDNEINIASVETPKDEKKSFFEKLFDKDDKKEKKKNEKKEDKKEEKNAKEKRAK
jgi:hypothetical protein